MEKIGIDGKIIIKCILETRDGRAWKVFVLLMAGTVGGPFLTR